MDTNQDDKYIHLEFSRNDLRTRFIISTIAVLKDEMYGIRENIIQIVKDQQVEKPYYMVDVLVRRNHFDSLREVTYYCIDILNEFLSQIATITYAPAEIVDIISTSPYYVEPGENFEMHLFDGTDDNRGQIEVTKDDIKIYSSSDKSFQYLNLLHILRDGLSTKSLESKFLNYFSVLDFIAQLETTTSIEVPCSNCGTTIQTHPATSNYILSIFENNGIDKKQYSKLRTLRSKIAHGAGNRDSNFYKILREQLPKLESVVFEEISTRVNIKIKRNSNVFFDLPFLKINAVKFLNTKWKVPSIFKLTNFSWHVKVGFSGLKNTDATSDKLAGEFGSTNNLEFPTIENYAWPY